MTSAAKSLFAFGIYVLLTGAAFIAAPDPIREMLQLPPGTSGWMRMIGMLALVIGAYDVINARNDVAPHLRASVWVRIGFAAGLAVIVAAREMPPSLLLFGAIEIAGAVWTAVALRRAASR